MEEDGASSIVKWLIFQERGPVFVQESKEWVEAKEAEFRKQLRRAFPELLGHREEEFLETHSHIIRCVAMIRR